MITIAEKIAETVDALSQRFSGNVPDWAIADQLNAPDDSQAPVVTLHRTLISDANVIDVLGADVAVARLATFDQAALADPKIARVMGLLYRGEVDIGGTLARTLLDNFVTAGLLSSAEGAAIKSLAETVRYPSWCETNQTFVDARSVGITRGAKP